MKILIDADSCPRQIRSIIIKAARRVEREALFAADRILSDCNGDYVVMVKVPPGDDHADDEVAKRAQPGDLVITRDVILASRVVKAGCIAVDDRGGVYTRENMAERLSVRNAMKNFREAGVFSERHRPIGKKEIQLFANALDSLLTRLLREESDFTAVRGQKGEHA
ncbi:MAG: DUF188 domain-containing protein [Spirochaetales bacterium]|jgi:uncharacterized protein YaiI (UPF0178 family)|nr:DUF188 domain-containing protein [Spirochaetales bacterium]